MNIKKNNIRSEIPTKQQLNMHLAKELEEVEKETRSYLIKRENIELDKKITTIADGKTGVNQNWIYNRGVTLLSMVLKFF